MKEQNVVGLILGNGMQNAPGGKVWDFDNASFRSAPRFAMCITYTDNNGNETAIEADSSFKWHASPIIFDDLRSGCFYDANRELSNWFEPDFDDSDWQFVSKAKSPKGEFRLCIASPIVITKKVSPVEKKPAGIFSLKFNCEKGREIFIQFSEHMRSDGVISYDKTGAFYPDGYGQTALYICKGEKAEKMIVREDFPSYGMLLTQ